MLINLLTVKIAVAVEFQRSGDHIFFADKQGHSF